MSDSTPRDPQKISDPAKEEFDRGCQFVENHDLAQAANAFHNALLDYKELRDDKGIANASDKLADVCLERGDFAKALPHLERAMAICEAANDDFSMTALRKKFARAYDGMGEHNKALEVNMVLLETYKAFGDPGSAVRTLETMAKSYLAMNDRERAADALHTAADIHLSFKHTRHASELKNQALELLKD
ncbi:MAG: tetratricopeptide repeat protein [Desulfobulbaceae bacterium]|nr:tetratricopeptide repeat protein [Desulfobulbaceae bacterium]